MNPAKSSTVLDFIHWIARNKKEIKNLKNLKIDDYMALVEEYMDSYEFKKPIEFIFSGQNQFKDQMRASYDYLMHSNGDWDNYDKVREELKKLRID